MAHMIKSGYIYVLVHPSDPDLYKIGVTVLQPEKRLAQHNRQFEKYAGQIVKRTGQKWELKTFFAVPDPYWAERAFWGATHFPDIPYRSGIEVEKMEWKLVLKGLEAAKKAGVRPGPGSLPDHVYAYTASIKKRLEGRDITLLGYVKSIISGKANFQCINGHVWRTTPIYVGEGQGCPECGIGTRNAEDIRQKINAGVICLLTHPDKPGSIRIGVVLGTIEDIGKENSWGDWEIHRYRHVEDVNLAETHIWNLLGAPLPHEREAFQKDLKDAEEAFRNLIGSMQKDIALEERIKEIGSLPK